MTASTILDRELETYRREFPKLKDQVGKFVLIQGDNVLSVWSTFDDAIQQGYRECGIDQPFLIKKIEDIESVHFQTRLIEVPCPI